MLGVCDILPSKQSFYDYRNSANSHRKGGLSVKTKKLNIHETLY